MIQRAFITQWGTVVPWSSPRLVEQDLIICRALVSIYSDPFLKEHLAFRGGTALHKLYLEPQPRYSEDIDLVQMNAEPEDIIEGKLEQDEYGNYHCGNCLIYKEKVFELNLKTNELIRVTSHSENTTRNPEVRAKYPRFAYKIIKL